MQLSLKQMECRTQEPMGCEKCVGGDDTGHCSPVWRLASSSFSFRFGIVRYCDVATNKQQRRGAEALYFCRYLQSLCFIGSHVNVLLLGFLLWEQVFMLTFSMEPYSFWGLPHLQEESHLTTCHPTCNLGFCLFKLKHFCGYSVCLCWRGFPSPPYTLRGLLVRCGPWRGMVFAHQGGRPSPY